MIHRVFIILVDSLAKDNQWVTDEQVPNVFGKSIIDSCTKAYLRQPLGVPSLPCSVLTIISQPLINLFVYWTFNVIVAFVPWICRDVTIDRIVTRFGYPVLVFLERLYSKKSTSVALSSNRFKQANLPLDPVLPLSGHRH